METPQRRGTSVPKMSEALAVRRETLSTKPQDNLTSVLCARSTAKPEMGETDVTRVTWESWRIAQSQFHYRPVGVVDLGEID
jgi:hypothetical protein